MPPHLIIRLSIINKLTPDFGEDVERKEPSFTVGMGAN